ncbi:MAG: C40 family peptidase [Rhodocyclaceae bacterium]|nr:C40 family peptidase [Rhodocyclaceae bacterium]MCB1964032.1 C40 family peptidase [Rhodocyclaceae bacterium]
MNTRTWWSIGGIITALAGCGSVPPVVRYTPPAVAESAVRDPIRFDDPRHAEQVVLYAYGLLGTGYQFGGRNPEAGLDCSGMVSYIVEQVSGKRLPHNAARIAAQTRSVERDDLQPGDLVFFNTLNRPHSHMGIYLGEGKFIHAPNSRGAVRIERLASRYFSTRFDGGRTLQPEI